MNDDLPPLIEPGNYTMIRKSDLKKEVPISFELYFEPSEKSELTGILDGFVAEPEEYDWFELDLSSDEKKPNPIYLVNPKLITKEKFLERNPGLHPSRVFMVTQENFDKFREELLKAYKEQMRVFSGKITSAVTFNPLGPIEVSE